METMVCDSSHALCVMAVETKAASQALDGLGCRPSPSFFETGRSPIVNAPAHRYQDDDVRLCRRSRCRLEGR